MILQVGCKGSKSVQGFWEEEEEACQDYYSHCDDHGGGGSETDGYLLLLVLFKACGVQSCHNNLK